MRTRAQMVDRVQRWLLDTDAGTYADATVEAMLEETAAAVWELMIAEPDSRRRRCLRKHSTWTALTAEQEEYDLPADCLLLEEVHIRWADADDRWTTLPYRQPGGSAPRGGTAALIATNASAGALAGWCDDTDEGSVRIWPELLSVNEEKVRFRYYHGPTFPPLDSDTFNVQSAVTVDALPEGVDALCELYATAMLAHEELDDRKPIGAFGGLFRARYDAFTRGRGAGATRVRRRIHLR